MFRDCNHCREWQYIEQGDQTGEPGTIRTSLGKPLKRRGPPPCEYGNCPKGHWSSPKSLCPMNEKALIHYEECKSTGEFPDDAIVKKNARIITNAIETAEKVESSFNGRSD